MRSAARGASLVELLTALAAATLLLLVLVQLRSALELARARQQGLRALQQHEDLLWRALATALQQLGGSALPSQLQAIPLVLRWQPGQGVAAARLRDGALVLLLRQQLAPGAPGCLGSAAAARIEVDAFYPRAGAWLCQPLAWRIDTWEPIELGSPQALFGGSGEPALSDWQLSWAVETAGGRLQWLPALPLPDPQRLRALRVDALLQAPGLAPRRVSRVFALPR